MQKDFLQVFVLAHALIDGVDPYQKMEVLIRQYVGATSHLFPHPTPHPVTLGMLFLVIGWCDYQTAMIGWFILEVVGFIAAMVFAARAYSLPVNPAVVVAVAVGVMCWWPIVNDLYWLNANALLTVLLAGGIFATSRRRSVLAGVLFGLSLLVKPVFWPVVVVLALRREWRSLIAAVACGVIGYSLAVVAIGPSRMLDYILHVLPENTRLYATSPWNFSVFGLAEKLNRGIGAADVLPAPHWWISSLPATDSPTVSTTFVLATTVGILAWLTVLTVRSRDALGPLSFAICASILVSPIVWPHYLVALVIPGTALMASLCRARFHSLITNATLLVGFLLAVRQFDWISLAYSAAGIPSVATRIGLLMVPGPPAVIPTLPSLIITLGPLLTVLCLTLLVSHMCMSSPTSVPDLAATRRPRRNTSFPGKDLSDRLLHVGVGLAGCLNRSAEPRSQTTGGAGESASDATLSPSAARLIVNRIAPTARAILVAGGAQCRCVCASFLRLSP